MAVLYTNNELSERETKTKIPLTIATKKENKILRNKFNQGGKRPVLGKLQNTEERNQGRYKFREAYTLFMGWKN